MATTHYRKEAMQAEQDKTYNGWKNYETWVVGMYLDGNYTGEGTYREALELVADAQVGTWDSVGNVVRIFAVAEAIESFVRESLPDLGASLEADLLGAALSEVDWRELAENKLSEI